MQHILWTLKQTLYEGGVTWASYAYSHVFCVFSFKGLEKRPVCKICTSRVRSRSVRCYIMLSAYAKSWHPSVWFADLKDSRYYTVFECSPAKILQFQMIQNKGLSSAARIKCPISIFDYHNIIYFLISDTIRAVLQKKWDKMEQFRQVLEDTCLSDYR